jgi:hypothetical protein
MAKTINQIRLTEDQKQMFLEDKPTATIKVKLMKKVMEEEDIDTISDQLQQLLYISGIDKIRKALIKLQYRGRIERHPILMVMQILQNFNTALKMKELIKELK